MYVAFGQTRLLIDAGLSRKEIVQRLQAIGETPEALSAVLVTHEHSDHVCGLARFLKAFNIPVYMTHLTAPGIAWEDCQPDLRAFGAGERFRIGDIDIQSFTVPHDAADPIGFCLTAGGIRIGVATDLGYVPESVKYHLRDLDFLLLESNHDLEMLKVGPYPWSVKQRVMGRNGHLSNDAVCSFILNELNCRLKTLVLAHLSEHNNYPAIVHMSAAQALFRRCLNPDLFVVEPRMQSHVFEF